MNDKKEEKEELFGWNEYLEEERAKGEADWVKAKESGTIIYLKHLEKRLGEMAIERKELQAEITQLKKKLHIIQTGSNLQQIIDITKDKGVEYE